MTFVPRKPDLKLTVTDRKHPKRRIEAGYAYKNAAGGYALRLHPGITLRWNDEVYLTIWPTDLPKRDIERAKVQDEEPPEAPLDEKGLPPPDESDIPF